MGSGIIQFQKIRQSAGRRTAVSCASAFGSLRPRELTVVSQLSGSSGTICKRRTLVSQQYTTRGMDMVEAHSRDRDPNATLVSATDTPALLGRVSWGGIFSGTVIALGLLVLLGMLGAAIGFRAVDPQQSAAFEGVGIGAGIWWIVTSIIALAVGGYVAGHLSGIPEKRSATAHGASVWGLVTLVMLWLAASTVGTAVNTATSAVAGIGQAAASAANTAASSVLSPGGVSEDQAANRVQQAVGEVRTQVEQVDEQQLRQEAAQTAETALDALSTANWYAFFASLLSLAAAVIAAGAGAPHRTFLAAREKVNL